MYGKNYYADRRRSRNAGNVFISKTDQFGKQQFNRRQMLPTNLQHQKKTVKKQFAEQIKRVIIIKRDKEQDYYDNC